MQRGLGRFHHHAPVVSIGTMRLVHRLHMLNCAKGSFTGSCLDAILFDAAT
jgi:hypothetical protein